MNRSYFCAKIWFRRRNRKHQGGQNGRKWNIERRTRRIPPARWWTSTVKPANEELQTEEYQQAVYNGKTILDVSDVEIKVAKYMGVPWFDLTSECGVNGFNYSEYISDNVHPGTSAGQKMLGRTIAQGISRILPVE